LFEDFDELIVRLNIETLDELEKEFERHRSAAPDPENKLLELAHLYLYFTGRHYNRWAAVLAYTGLRQHRHKERLQARIGLLVGTVEEVLAPLFMPGEEADRRLAAAVLWTGLEGISTLSALNTVGMVAPVQAWDMAHSLITNYLGGLDLRHQKGVVWTPNSDRADC
jgi:hypothetical protein